MQHTKNIFFLLAIKRKDFRIKRVFAQKKAKGCCVFCVGKDVLQKRKIIV